MGRCFVPLPERIPKVSRRSANGNEAVSLFFGIHFILIVIGVRNVSCSYGFLL